MEKKNIDRIKLIVYVAIFLLAIIFIRVMNTSNKIESKDNEKNKTTDDDFKKLQAVKFLVAYGDTKPLKEFLEDMLNEIINYIPNMNIVNFYDMILEMIDEGPIINNTEIKIKLLLNTAKVEKEILLRKENINYKNTYSVYVGVPFCKSTCLYCSFTSYNIDKYKEMFIEVSTDKEKYAKIIDKAIFPGTQGGPLMHIIAAKAVALGEALTDDFKDYQKRIVENAKVLSESLLKKGLKLVSGGTDNHLMLLDLRGTGITGKELSRYSPCKRFCKRLQAFLS